MAHQKSESAMLLGCLLIFLKWWWWGEEFDCNERDPKSFYSLSGMTKMHSLGVRFEMINGLNEG